MRLFILATIAVMLLFTACAEPETTSQVTPSSIKSEKKLSETAHLVFKSNITGILGRAADLLLNAGLPQGQTLVTRLSPNSTLPHYGIIHGVLNYPSKNAAGNLARRIEQAFQRQLLADTNGKQVDKRDGVQRTLFILFFFHELGIHIRRQYKLAQTGNNYDDYLAAWNFSAAMLSSFEKNAPELTELRKMLITALEELMINAPEELKSIFDLKEAHKWYAKNAGQFNADPENKVLAFHLFCMHKALQDNNDRDIQAFAKDVQFDIKSIRDRIVLFNPKAQLQEIYTRRASRISRKRASRGSGIDIITLDPEGRLYYGRRGAIGALRPHGNVIKIVESRQTRFDPGCFLSPTPGTLVFYQSGYRVMLDLVKKKIHFKAVKLKPSGTKKNTGGFPFAIDPKGAEYIDIGKAIIIVTPDGKISNPLPVSGTTGGLAFVRGRLYRTNISQHTVEFLDRDSGKWKILAGVRNIAGHRDGKLYGSAFNEPCGIATDTAGNIYVADRGNHAVRVISPDGSVRTLAGIYRGTSGLNSATQGFNLPRSVAVAPDGTVYVAEKSRFRICAIGKSKDVPKSAPFKFPGVNHSYARIRDLSREIRNMPFTHELYLAIIKRANAYNTRQEYGKAIADLNHAIELEPEQAKAYLRLAKLYIKIDEVENAVGSYKKLIELLEKLPPTTYFSNPSYLQAYLQLADLYQNSGDGKSAEKTLKKTLNLHRKARRMAIEGLSNEHLAELNLKLGIFALKAGKHKQAIRNLNEAAKLSPKTAEIYGRRGEAYLAMDNVTKGFKDLREARIRDTRYSHPHLILAKHFDKKRNYSVALHHFKRYISLGGKDADVKTRIEELEELIEERKSAMSTYTDTIEEDSQARVWRVRRFQNGTEERTLIDK